MKTSPEVEAILSRIDCRAVLGRVIELACAVERHKRASARHRKAQKHYAAMWTKDRLLEAQAAQKRERLAANAKQRALLKLLRDSVESAQALIPLVEPAEGLV